MKEQKPFNKLQIIKSTIIKKDKLFKAQLEMAKNIKSDPSLGLHKKYGTYSIKCSARADEPLSCFNQRRVAYFIPMC